MGKSGKSPGGGRAPPTEKTTSPWPSDVTYLTSLHYGDDVKRAKEIYAKYRVSGDDPILASAASTKKIARSRRRRAWTFERRAGGDGDARGATDADMVCFARRTTVRKTRAVRVHAGKGPNVDRTTGYIESDNTGSGNIFAIEPRQLYTESPTSDKYAKQGLGGIGGVIVAVGVLGAVAFATKGLAGFEEANNEFANYNGPSVSALEQQFER